MSIAPIVFSILGTIVVFSLWYLALSLAKVIIIDENLREDDQVGCAIVLILLLISPFILIFMVVVNAPGTIIEIYVILLCSIWMGAPFGVMINGYHWLGNLLFIIRFVIFVCLFTGLSGSFVWAWKVGWIYW